MRAAKDLLVYGFALTLTAAASSLEIAPIAMPSQLARRNRFKERRLATCSLRSPWPSQSFRPARAAQHTSLR